MQLDRIYILGVGVSPVNIEQAANAIENWVTERESAYICVTPAHSIMNGYRDLKLRKTFNASSMNTPDGMGVVWLLRLMGNKNVGRVYGPDLMEEVCGLSTSHKWRHYFFGGAPGVPDKVARNLTNRYPGLQVAGVYSPPFGDLTSQEDEKIIQEINQSNADLVWVGTGSPKQEFWMSEHVRRINAPVMIGVGAAFDFNAGTKPQAPRWIQRSGLEWLFRLASEPKRLWPRYRQYPYFVFLVVLQLLHLRKYPTD